MVASVFGSPLGVMLTVASARTITDVMRIMIMIDNVEVTFFGTPASPFLPLDKFAFCIQCSSGSPPVIFRKQCWAVFNGYVFPV